MYEDVLVKRRSTIRKKVGNEIRFLKFLRNRHQQEGMNYKESIKRLLKDPKRKHL